MLTKHVFIIGSKGIPARYGGFETFVEQLTGRRVNEETEYHVSCLAEQSGQFEHNQARCFQVKVPRIGSARAVLYDLLSLRECIKYIKRHRLTDCIVYILACRIGPFFKVYKRALTKLGVAVFVNPDGHEWKRGKWSRAVQQYWKLSERLMVKHADLLVCDSRGIEAYIHEEYARYEPRTTFIAYGADLTPSLKSDQDAELVQWMEQFQIRAGEYYLIIGRFVPENNYELMITEFMKSQTMKDLVVITGKDNNPFYDELLQRTRLDQDPRIKFVGTVYNEQLLKKIRELAYGYCHGHEVGGTNPSLLEALASTKLNLLFDVVFNREVGGNGAVYFSSEPGSMSALIQEVDRYDAGTVKDLESNARNRISEEYTWEHIVQAYEKLFLTHAFTLPGVSHTVRRRGNKTVSLHEQAYPEVSVSGNERSS